MLTISPLKKNNDFAVKFRPHYRGYLFSSEQHGDHQSCEGSHRERVSARSGSGQHSTAHFYMSALLHNEVWPDLQYSRETRHESRGLPTITRPDNLWSELQDLMPVMSSKHSPRGLSGYSSKFLSPLHSGVPHVQWIRSGPLGQGWTRGWPHWGVWLAHEKPGSPAPFPNGPASGSSGKRNILDENICLKPRTLND